MRYIETTSMAADIFSKHFSDEKMNIWKGVRANINVFSESELSSMWGEMALAMTVFCLRFRKI